MVEVLLELFAQFVFELDEVNDVGWENKAMLLNWSRSGSLFEAALNCLGENADFVIDISFGGDIGVKLDLPVYLGGK